MAKEIPSPQLPAALADPGLILRLSIGLGDQNHIFQAESFLDRDSTQEEIDTLADRMARAGLRLKAKHDLPGLRRQLDNVETKTRDNRTRLARLEAGLKAAGDVREEEARKLSAQHQETLKREEAAWYAEGKRGDFKPRGAAAGTLNRLKAAIDQLTAGQTKDVAEATQQKSVLDNEIAEGERAMAQLGRLIAEAEAMARGEDISGVEA